MTNTNVLPILSWYENLTNGKKIRSRCFILGSLRALLLRIDDRLAEMLSELKGRAPVRQKTHTLEGLQLNQVIFSTTGVGGNPWRNNLQTAGNLREDPKTTRDGITPAQLTEIQQAQHKTAFTLPCIGHTEVCLCTHTPRYPILYKICICVGFSLFAFGF